MSHPSKKKGYTFEVEVVKAAEKAGLGAERAWGSDGRSLGLDSEVDVLVSADLKDVYTLQCKRSRSISAKYKPSEGIYGQVFREDRGETMIMIRLKDFYKLIADSA